VNLAANPWSVSLLFNCGKPIQAAPVVTLDELGRPMIFFGTGAYLQASDVTNTSAQAIYGITDDNSGATISVSDLVDQTSSIHAVTSGKRGWYVNLVENAGERVTRSAALVAGTLYLPSFLPNADACAGGGRSWLYSLDYNDGSAPDNSNGTENNTTAGRVDAMGDGILADPSVDLVNEALILQSSNAVLLTHHINAGLKKLMVRSWRQKWN
jgi:Tfp pilus tip-associated adhesin PilY1